MITQKEIAAKLNLSQKTVSRVINGETSVTQETRERVMELVNAHNYTLNINARNLCTKRRGAIGILLSNKSSLQSIYFLQTFQGVNEVVSERHHHVIFAADPDPSTLLRVDNQVDGFIVFNIKGISVLPNDLFKRLKRLKKPMLLIQSKKADVKIPCIHIDNFQGGFDATEYLIKIGHERIGFWGGGDNSHESQARLAGFEAALKKHKLPIKKNYVNQTSQDSFSSDYKQFMVLRARESLTAVFVWSDTTARKLIYECEKDQIQIPNDLSVIGFDDRICYTLMTQPFLTTMRQPFYELGQKAARFILDKIAGHPPQDSLIVHPQLVIRQTTAPTT